jgi:hypothetical protein
MKTTTVIESETENLCFYLWDDEKDEMIEVEEMSDEEIDKILKRPEIMKLLLKSLLDLVREIRSTVGEDVKEIWKRMDEIENK